MLDALGQGLLDVVSLGAFISLFAGTLAGLILGVVPGLGGLVGVALILPFIYGMDPYLALPFILALQSVTATGGSVTAILINIPGTEINVATLLDGFPMTKKGEGARAIGAGLTSSGLGGLAAVFFAFLCIPLVIPLVINFHTSELFLLILLGVSFIAVMGSGGSGARIKGLISGGLGLLLSLSGFQAITGDPRFTFGTTYLFDGLGLVPVILGLFAGAELVDMAVSSKAIASGEAVATKEMTRGLLKGAKDVLYHKGLWLRSTLIGFGFGLIPGVGAPTATFVAYGHGKQTSKQPQEFGKGCVEGVIAPEGANNAKEAGALLTTLAFGIPGSAVMALNLAAFLILGLKPGPGMLTENMPLSFSMLWAVAISNLIGAVICFLLAPYLVRLTSIHPHYLFPLILTIVFVGAFSTGETMLNIIVLMIFTLLGILMKRFKYSRAALVLGFVLGSLFEEYLWLSIKLGGPLFFLRPISLGIILVIIGVFTFGTLRSLLTRLLGKRPAP